MQSFAVTAGRDMYTHAQTDDASPNWRSAAVGLSNDASIVSRRQPEPTVAEQHAGGRDRERSKGDEQRTQYIHVRM
jgi:hypothetical protein